MSGAKTPAAISFIRNYKHHFNTPPAAQKCAAGGAILRRCGMPPANYRIWLMFLANSINVESGAVQLPVPVKDGAQFVGLHISPDYSDECVQSVVCSAADITLCAEWSDRVYTVEYDLGGGMLYGENPSSATVQGVVALASPVRLGYIFLGWYDSPSGGERYESVGGAGACNVTLYARWQQSDELFAISYGLDGGTAEGDNPVSVGAGEVHELFPEVKAGHEFLGWNTSPDGSGEYVQALYGVDGDMALYAKRYRLLLFPFRYRPCRRFGA